MKTKTSQFLPLDGKPMLQTVKRIHYQRYHLLSKNLKKSHFLGFILKKIMPANENLFLSPKQNDFPKSNI